MLKLQKSPPWKLKSPPKSRKSQNRPNNPLGAILPTLKTTALRALACPF